MITLDQYLQGRDKTFPEEYNEEIKQNAEELLFRVNNLIDALKLSSVEVSSGWRPPSYNRTVKGAALRSKHTTGQAIDLADSNGKLKQAILRAMFFETKFLERMNLFMEDPASTKTWVHLQTMPPKSGKRVFKP